MSNSYPKLLEQCVEALDSARGFAPSAVAHRIFETLVDDEPSIADARAFRLCELGQFAQRGLQEKVRKDTRNLTSSDPRQLRLFPDLDLRYTVPQADGGERQIEHARMTRDEWLRAEDLLRNKAIETLRKADALEQCRMSFDHLWAKHPEMTSEEAFRKAAVKNQQRASGRPSALAGRSENRGACR